LLMTALAKFVSGNGTAQVLQVSDPIFGIPFNNMLRLVGGFELIAAGICLFYKRTALQAVLIAWLATSFLAYRLALLRIDYHGPCGCLGNLTGAIHMPAETAGLVLKIILIYLLIGSYACLFYCWRRNRPRHILRG